jgi:hypothetical protein
MGHYEDEFAEVDSYTGMTEWELAERDLLRDKTKKHDTELIATVKRLIYGFLVSNYGVPQSEDNIFDHVNQQLPGLSLTYSDRMDTHELRIILMEMLEDSVSLVNGKYKLGSQTR